MGETEVPKFLQLGTYFVKDDRRAQQGADGEVTQQGGYSERRRRHRREAACRQQDQGGAEQVCIGQRPTCADAQRTMSCAPKAPA